MLCRYGNIEIKEMQFRHIISKQSTGIFLKKEAFNRTSSEILAMGYRAADDPCVTYVKRYIIELLPDLKTE